MPASGSFELSDEPTQLTGLEEGTWYSFQVTTLRDTHEDARVRTAEVAGSNAPPLDHAGKIWKREALFDVQGPEAPDTIWAWCVGSDHGVLTYDEIGT